ncbi:MAG: hypothetical protein PXX73_05280, partial [Sideroxydans sp.]|nr:hypothetical protein [Sideroxydans sp.]
MKPISLPSIHHTLLKTATTLCSLILMVYALPSQAGMVIHAAGAVATGATRWATCAGGCHGGTGAAAPSATAFVYNTIAYYAQNPANFTNAISNGANRIAIQASMGSPATANTNANIAELNQNDLSAYFASLQTPVISHNQVTTVTSGAAYNGAIVPVAGQDYLVNNTTYGITPAGSGMSVNTVGALLGSAPAVTVPTNYNITLSAANGALTGTANLALTVNPATQTPVFSPAPTIAVGGTGQVSATSGGSTQSIIYSSLTPTICTLTGTTVTGVNASITPPAPKGQQTPCRIQASQAAGFNAAGKIGYAAGTAIQSFYITPALQTITLGTAPALSFNGTGSISATGGASGNAIVFSGTTSVCTTAATSTTSASISVIGNAGTACTITANQAGSANYTAATPVSTLPITISAAPQTISYTAVPALALGGSGTISATGGASNNPVSLSSLTPGVCTLPPASISPALITVAAGAAQGSTCQISASQAGNGNYAAATTLTQNITLGLGAQTLSFAIAPTVVVGGTGSVSASSSAGLTPVTYSTTSAACSVTAAGLVTGISTTPTCLITATQAGNAGFAAASATQNLSITPGSQVLKFQAVSPLTVGGTASAISVISFEAIKGGLTNLLATLTSNTPNVCTLTGSPAAGYSITPLSAGTCTVLADQAGDANYFAAPQNPASYSVGAGTQTISAVIPPVIAVNTSGTISATQGASTSPVIFSSLTAAICSATGVNGATITGISAGTCLIAADQAADANYAAAAQVQTKFTVGLGTQTITFGAAPALAVGGTGTLQATASSGLAVSFSSTTPSICSVTGNVVSALSAGNCVVAANQAGDANYNAATQVTQTLTFIHLAPIARAATLTVPLNTPATLDLAASITGTSLTGVMLVTPPA